MTFKDQGFKPPYPIKSSGKCLFGLGEQPLYRIVMLHQLKKWLSCHQFVVYIYINFQHVTGGFEYPN
jgi:hypothetical protein